MSKLTIVIVGVFGSLAIAAGTMQGCGGSSSGNSNVALCEQVCDKGFMCTPDAGAQGQQALTACKQSCATQVPNTNCSNASAITSAINNCLGMDCAGYFACVPNIPPCQSTTGTGGSTGAGGTTGTGGGGGGDCSVCTKADQCCTALSASANCVLAQTCTGATGQQQLSVIMACQSLLDTAAQQPTAPAACR
jgi:hypothetical protein